MLRIFNFRVKGIIKINYVFECLVLVVCSINPGQSQGNFLACRQGRWSKPVKAAVPGS